MQPTLSRCGYRCDLCLAYRPNVAANPANQQALSDGWHKYFGFRLPPDEICCDGCLAENARLIDQGCPVRPCVIKSGLDNCAQCERYVCDRLAQRLVACEDVERRHGAPIPKADRARFIAPYENKQRLDALRGGGDAGEPAAEGSAEEGPAPILSRLASAQGRRDDVPNQALARDLARAYDREGIRQVAAHLWSCDAQVQSDCIKVLYEIGYINPLLIADHAADFLHLLQSRNNRLVWGAMIALSTIAAFRPQVLFDGLADIAAAVDKGTVITADAGVSALAAVAASDDARRQDILPYLFEHLGACRAKDVAGRAERILAAVDAASSARFVAILEKRLPGLSPAQQQRVRRVVGKANKLG